MSAVATQGSAGREPGPRAARHPPCDDRPSASASRVELRPFADAASLAAAAARDFLEAVDESQREGRGFHVALSGGRIAAEFFKFVTRLAGAPTASPAGPAGTGERLGGVRFFWADERCVPPDAAESNYRVAREALLEPLGIRTGVFRIRGELPPQRGAEEASATLAREVPSGPAGVPVLDFVLLGMGEDGHIASIFPDGLAAANSATQCYLSVVGPKPPPDRVTLTMGPLAAARQAWVLASGAGKEAALAGSLEEDGRMPLAQLLRRRAATRIYTDIARPTHTRAAAAGQGRPAEREAPAP